MAAGETKSHLIASAVLNEPHIDFPATVLQKIKGSRFYITKGIIIS